jgi:5'-3' exonuclease
MDKLILVDGMNLVYRSHFAHRLLATASKPTSVLYGFLAAYERLMAMSHNVVVVWENGFSPAISFDVPQRAQSWRAKLCATYKANRKSSDEMKVAVGQVPELIRVLRMIGARQVGLPDVEADDLVFMVVCSVSFPGAVFVYSTDRDFYQLVSDARPVYVLRPEYGKGERVIDARAVRNEYGVLPEDFAALKALMGDSTDNYKALPGIGPKKALPMLCAGVDPRVARFEQLPEKTRSEYAWVAEHWDKLRLCYDLAKLRSDPPMSEDAARIWALQRACLRTAFPIRRPANEARKMRDAFRSWCEKNLMREFHDKAHLFIPVS